MWRAGATVHCGSLASPRWLLLLWGTGFRLLGFSSCSSWALECWLSSRDHGLRCSPECGIFPDQGSNSRHLDWQADSYPLRSLVGLCVHAAHTCKPTHLHTRTQSTAGLEEMRLLGPACSSCAHLRVFSTLPEPRIARLSHLISTKWRLRSGL